MNGFEAGNKTRNPAVLGKPIVDPANWSKEEFRDNTKYLYHLSPEEVEEILRAAWDFEQTGKPLKYLSEEDFHLPIFQDTLENIIHEEVINGRGFIFIRGIPVENRSVLQNAVIQWGMACYLGSMLPQNKQGNLLEHVKDAGGNIHSPTGRGYNSANKLGFHSDSADAFSLMCLRNGKSGGEHSIVSSVTLYNKILELRPDLAKELEFSFYRSRRGEIPEGEVPYIRQPVFSVTDGFFSSRGASSTINRAQDLPEVPKLSEKQWEAIHLFQDLCGKLSLKIDWQPGDISFVLNHVALHARTAYEDWPEPERKRHLLRLWINLDKKRPVHQSIASDMSGIKLPVGTEMSTPLEMTVVA
ncbi:MAG: TauD/TfdA family dioxygenase [Rhodospirillaceae bacterium]